MPVWPKPLDAERARAVARDGAEPGERRRVAVEHGDEAAARGHVGQQALDVARGAELAALARAAGAAVQPRAAGRPR